WGLATRTLPAPSRRATAIRVGVFALLHGTAQLGAAASPILAAPDHWAHAGGAAAGMIVAAIAGRASSRLRIVAAAGGAAAAIALVVALAPPPLDWRGDLQRAAELERR